MTAPSFISLADARRPLFAGIDIGGTNIKFGIVDDSGHSLGKSSIPTQVSDGPAAAMERTVNGLRSMAEKIGITFADIPGIGVGTPGFLDIEAGILLDPPNLPGWWNFPLRGHVANITGLPTTFANDANAAAFGEWWAGRGKEHHSIVMFTLGTGVGGGIIIGDLSIDGEYSHGSELGHTIIDYAPSARPCPCGHTGHLEAYCSASALVKRCGELLHTGRSSSLRDCRARGENITPLVIAREAEAGDPFALEIILEVAMFLGVGVTNLMHTIDPGAVVIGGAMTFGANDTALGRQFLERVREEVRRRAFAIPAKNTTIDFATLGGDAGYIGAAGLAQAAHRKKK